jgi:aminoglycoside phosphotransferase
MGVAWPYLSQTQRGSFKEQTRELLQKLHSIKPSNKHQARSHIVQDPHILSNGRLNPIEAEILFSESNTDPDLSFMHNDVTQSNIIVNNDKIVGLIDWEMAGYFGWKTASEVHRRIRTLQREHFVNANLSEETLRDMMFWNDLYDVAEVCGQKNPVKTH